MQSSIDNMTQNYTEQANNNEIQNNNNLFNNMDRSYYRNYLYRRRLLNSESSKNDSENDNNELESSINSQSNHDPKDLSQNKFNINYDETTLQNKNTDLFKYYLSDQKEIAKKHIESPYTKFNVNNADEEDYKNLYNAISETKLHSRFSYKILNSEKIKLK